MLGHFFYVFGLKLRYGFRRTKINRQEDEYM